MTKSKVTKQLLAGFAATMSLAGAGFGFGWPSPSLPKLLSEDAEISLTSDESAWVVSVFTIGSATGALIGASLVDKCGRKRLLLSTIIPYLIACILISVAQSFWWFMAARIFGGLGTGMGFTVVPMYAGEIADERIRGAVSGMLDPTVNVLVVIIYCVGPWVSIRTLALVGGVFPIVFGLMFVWMPESPYFLIMKQKPEQAEKSLMWLRGNGDVSAELAKIQKNVESQQKDAGTIMDLVTIPGNRKALIIVVGLMAAQQFSGISAVVSYSSLIFDEAGSTLDPSICVIILGIVQILAGAFAAVLVDMAGRRLLMLTSTFGSVLFLAGVAVYFHLQAMGTDVSSMAWIPVTSTIGFIVICTLGLGSLPFVVLSELFPCNVKASALMAANVTGSVISVVVTKLYQVVADSYGIHASFWGFAVVTIFMGIFIYFTLPETKKRSLQEIQDYLHKTNDNNSNKKVSYKIIRDQI